MIKYEKGETMQEFTVKDVSGLDFVLETPDGEEKSLKIKFFDLPREMEKGDKILIRSELLDKNYKEFADVYYFGDIKSDYGRDIKDKQSPDFLIVVQDNKQIFLKRFYG